MRQFNKFGKLLFFGLSATYVARMTIGDWPRPGEGALV